MVGGMEAGQFSASSSVWKFQMQRVVKKKGLCVPPLCGVAGGLESECKRHWGHLAGCLWSWCCWQWSCSQWCVNTSQPCTPSHCLIEMQESEHVACDVPDCFVPGFWLGISWLVWLAQCCWHKRWYTQSHTQHSPVCWEKSPPEWL